MSVPPFTVGAAAISVHRWLLEMAAQLASGAGFQKPKVGFTVWRGKHGREVRHSMVKGAVPGHPGGGAAAAAPGGLRPREPPALELQQPGALAKRARGEDRPVEPHRPQRRGADALCCHPRHHAGAPTTGTPTTATVTESTLAGASCCGW